MSQLLILSSPQDVHAISVKIALERLGVKVDFLASSDFPEKLSISFTPEQGVWLSEDSQKKYQLHDYDAVWLRKIPRFYNLEGADENSRKVIETETRALSFGSFFAAQRLHPHCKWINDPIAQSAADYKVFQLQTAQSVGFRLPETLISNNLHDIDKFLSQDPGHIYKPFYPWGWRRQGKLRRCFTTDISTGQLGSERDIAFSPGIYQRKIKKRKELRVTFFADEMITAELDSQTQDAASVDWRIVNVRVPVAPGQLPQPIADQCRRMMKILGLTFGAFDFIVDEKGDHIFLEVNPVGQWLWLEDVNAELTLLDFFCKRFLNLMGIPVPDPDRVLIRYGDIREEVRAQSKRNQADHLPFRDPYIFDCKDEAHNPTNCGNDAAALS